MNTKKEQRKTDYTDQKLHKQNKDEQNNNNLIGKMEKKMYWHFER